MTLRLGGQDYFRTDLHTTWRLDAKGERVPRGDVWGCRQCGQLIWYMNLHDGICPGLSKYDGDADALAASREFYR